MNKTNVWKCEVCGYISESAESPDNCPVCGVGKESFNHFEIAAAEEARPVSSSWRCSICSYVHNGECPPEVCPICGAGADLFEAVQEEGDASAVSPQTKRIVIVGSGIAGLTAARHARLTSPLVEIILVSKEKGLPYYRLNLTRYLAGEIMEKDLDIEPQSWFDENRIDLIHGEARAIETNERRVILNGDRMLEYGRLILANGSHPFVPPIPGANREGVKVLRTLRDAEDVIKQAEAGERCVCIGGGLLGLEAAGALKTRNLQVAVLEGFDWLLPRQLPQKAGIMLENHLETLGISIRCGVKIKEITGDENVRAVRLENGEEIPADLVVLSTGVRPNSYLARQSRIKVKSGVIVDDRLFTSDPSVLAAGDVAEHRGRLYGIWPASYAQGVTAGINAADGDSEFEGLSPSNRLKVLNIDIFSVGQINVGDAGFQFFEKQDENSYVGIVCRDNQIAGAALYGDIALANPLKEAVDSQTQIPELKSILDKLPEFADFVR